MQSEGPATGHLDTGFLGFPVFKQMLRWFPSSKLLLHAYCVALSILKLIKKYILGVQATKLLHFLNYYFNIKYGFKGLTNYTLKVEFRIS
jgi:hypothetical protein